MSRLSSLMEVTEDEKRAILDHYSMTEEQFEENVKILRTWIKQSGHLPQEEDENKFRLVLLNCKMSMEKAKQCVEGYYRIRTRYAHEFFDKLIPNAKDYLQSKNLAKSVVMPKLTPDLCRITIFKLTDPEGLADDALIYHIPVFMITEMRLTKELCLSNIILIDFSSYSWKNLIKYTPTVNQKLVDMLISVNIRIHSLHFINVTGFMDHIMRVLKSFVPGKIVNKIIIHKSRESLWEYIPKECLPKDYGGTQKPLDEIYSDWCEQIEESEELFKKLLSAKSSAKFELDPSQQDVFGCGAEGSFRQLVLD
ncbi:alpha-tocopherol transfer protein-like [Dendroctonus ponderosae]|uniref:alpha-tocopherol transfer protein-like n=1 Tax=Dendroctonus ponderosae TaxID=77166 RepID=UPI0020362AF9|nr:alpha-tocopherol transfer protein-like [Dendroctonus ponderosae]XP_048519203.1 alpha-tocopherol transfer protein-like [Dendroctonus ponderosae]XP_048519207.1 alpha-tocopherol transfer protein-like [Dendroctonus ponderosae]XP_048519208.1 alpha-tocopherol transfer protein-like [Dendroctonus ponderosae]KAH1000045.1 hypothetical protein HUJ05_009679 [Dendroctonus ponderosae]KAH1000046.1 hypothetical protein HUJ05_009679 [Dendroctonus ponderosae]KAH1000047.1 hypothetical protein HUJ05_009679 [D